MKLGRMLKISLKAVVYASATLAMAAIVEGMPFKQRTRPKPRMILSGEHTFESPFVGEPPHEKTMRALQELSKSGEVVIQALMAGGFPALVVNELPGLRWEPDALHALRERYTVEQKDYADLAETHRFLDVNRRFSKPLGSFPAPNGEHVLLEVKTLNHLLLIPKADVVVIHRHAGRVSIVWRCPDVEALL